MQNGTLVKTIFLKATPESVWAYLTEADKLGEWFHKAKETLTEGNEYALLSDSDDNCSVCWGKVLEAKPHSKLVYSFTHDYLGSHKTTVTWELSAQCDGTQLVMTHTGLETSAKPLDMLTSHDKGWDDHFIKLREKAS